MKGFFAKLAYKINVFMRGRYGSDLLNLVILCVSLVISLSASLFRLPFLTLIAFPLVCLALFRSLSRNVWKRQREMYVFRKFLNVFKRKRDLIRCKRRDRKTHLYFKCSYCKAVLRVPRNKGKISVCCPKCGGRTIKKT